MTASRKRNTQSPGSHPRRCHRGGCPRHSQRPDSNQGRPSRSRAPPRERRVHSAAEGAAPFADDLRGVRRVWLRVVGGGSVRGPSRKTPPPSPCHQKHDAVEYARCCCGHYRCRCEPLPAADQGGDGRLCRPMNTQTGDTNTARGQPLARPRAQCEPEERSFERLELVNVDSHDQADTSASRDAADSLR